MLVTGAEVMVGDLLEPNDVRRAAIMADPTPHLGQIYRLCRPIEMDQAGIALFAGRDEVIRRVTGQAPMTVQQFVAAHIDLFGGHIR